MKSGKSSSSLAARFGPNVESKISAQGPTPGGWTVQNPSPDSNPIFAITCPSTTECIAVGLDGILETTDAGGHWTTTDTGGNLMYAVTCVDIDHCLAVGSGGTAFSTSNASTTATWGGPLTITPGLILYGVSCPGTTFCVVVGQGGAIYSGDPAVGLSPQTSGTTNDLFGISCPSSTMCVAVGAAGQIRTNDGSSTWTSQAYGATASFFGVSCPTTSVCTVAGQGGIVWSTTLAPGFWSGGGTGTSASLSGVSCHSTKWCYIAGTDGSVYVRPATMLTKSPVHGFTGATGALFSISCPSDTTCYGAGENGIIVSTTNGATGWTQQTGLPAKDFYAASCPSTTVCYVVGYGGQIYDTTNGGSTWTGQTSGTQQALHSIACIDTTTCYVVGDQGTILKTVTSGSTWSGQTSPTSLVLVSVSCPAANTCYAVLGTGQLPQFIQTQDGTNWVGPRPIGSGTVHASGLVNAVSCPNLSSCYATINDQAGHPQIWRTSDGGNNWSLNFDLTQDPDGGFQPGLIFSAIKCPSSLNCYAVGNLGLTVATSDGGANWRTDTPVTTAVLNALTCPSASTCVAAATDATVIRTDNAGGQWTVQDTGFPGQWAYADVACADASTCLAIGAGGVAATTTTAGAAWSTLRPTRFAGSIDRISCFDSTNCYAAAFGDLLFTHNGGVTWADHTLGTTDILDSISCPSPSSCYAVGWPGAIYKTTDGGASWTYQPSFLSGADRTLQSVSCPTTTNCVAVGTDGLALSTSDGTSWAQEITNTTVAIDDVSCPSSTWCIAVGPNGLAMSRNGGAWHTYASSTSQTLHGVSCPLVGTCFAVGNAGTIVETVNSGVSWNPQTSGTTVNMLRVSCPLTTMCLAAGNFGTAMVTVDGKQWSQLSVPTINSFLAVAFPDANHAWLAGLGGTILANSYITNACGTATVAAAQSSPQTVGSSVTLNANSTGCTSPHYEFWLGTPSGSWYLEQPFSYNPIWNWNTAGLPGGTYSIHVWANQAGDATSSWEALATTTFTLVVLSSCTSAGLSPPNPSEPAGATVNLTASSTGCPDPLYEFWAGFPDGSWRVVQPWGGPALAWSTAGLAPGTYPVHVWANERYHSTNTWEGNGFTPVTLTGCTSASLSPPSVSQVAGSTVSLTASSTGCPNPLYEYWVGYPDGSWHIIQGFAANGAFNWNTTGWPTGAYSVHVWANQQGASTVTWEGNGAASVTLTSGFCTAASLSPVNPNAPAGSTVALTASSSSCVNPRYEFWVQYLDGSWHMMQGFSPSNSFSWSTAGLAPGTYTVHVWANNAGDSTATWEANGTDTVTLTGCTSAGLSPSNPSQPAGSTVAFTATSTGCLNPLYEYWVQDLNGNWSMKRAFSSDPTFNWNTAGLAPGTYKVHVWANNASDSTATWEANGADAVTLTGCTGAYLSPANGSAVVGTKVTFTASSGGCPNPQYEFWLEYPDGSWHMMSSFTTGNTWQWDTTGFAKGTYTIHAWANQQGAYTGAFEIFGSATYTLT
jgi:photosystem II stability/assembly factor-like uncharacterized protein